MATKPHDLVNEMMSKIMKDAHKMMDMMIK
jgi:hypothetical protein